MSDLGVVKLVPKTGEEAITDGGVTTGRSLLDYWRWSRSDLINNTERGVLAEYIVAIALKMDSGVREAWGAHDLTLGGTKIEVKSSAYIQSWGQKRPSRISFGIRPTRAWDAETDQLDDKQKRQADVYVFCLLAHRDQTTVNPLELAQWEFYVLSTDALSSLGDQKTVSLATLEKMGATTVPFNGIREAIVQAVRPNMSRAHTSHSD